MSNCMVRPGAGDRRCAAIPLTKLQGTALFPENAATAAVAPFNKYITLHLQQENTLGAVPPLQPTEITIPHVLSHPWGLNERTGAPSQQDPGIFDVGQIGLPETPPVNPFIAFIGLIDNTEEKLEVPPGQPVNKYVPRFILDATPSGFSPRQAWITEVAQ